MIICKEITDFEEAMHIPCNVLDNLSLSCDNIVYWYVQIVDDVLVLSVSFNEFLVLDNLIYSSTNHFSIRENLLIFPTEIINMMKMEGKLIQWRVHSGRPELSFNSRKKIRIDRKSLNLLVTDIISDYDHKNNGIFIPEQVSNLGNFKESKFFCCLCKLEGRDVFFLTNNKKPELPDEYQPIIIFMTKISLMTDYIFLSLDNTLISYLKPTPNERIQWSVYYYHDRLLVGFERIIPEDELEYTNIIHKDNNYYINIPHMISEELKLSKNNVLWKRYKYGRSCKTILTCDKPRFYNHRRSGKFIEKTSLYENLARIPDIFVKKYNINSNTRAHWLLNKNEKKYKYAELSFINSLK